MEIGIGTEISVDQETLDMGHRSRTQRGNVNPESANGLETQKESVEA